MAQCPACQQVVWKGTTHIPAGLTKIRTPHQKGSPCHPYLMIHAGMPIGYLQAYRMSDHPQYNAHVGVDEDTAGVDLLIGEADYLDAALELPSCASSFKR